MLLTFPLKPRTCPPDRRGGEHGFYYNGVRQFGFPDFKTDIRLHQWTHYCHVFSSGLYTAYVQGKERIRGEITTSIIPLALNSTLTLGQEQDLLAGAFDVEQIFRGFISQVNIWNRSFTKVEVEEQAACSTAPLGNIFSTDRNELELFSVLETLEKPEVFCEEEARYVIFPEPRYIEDSILLCKRMGYKVFSPSTREQNLQLHNESLQFVDSCSSNYHLWIGITDADEEGVWRKFSDDSEIEPFFELTEPNGGYGENCMLMFLPNGLWVDTSCAIQWPACVPCEVTHTTPLRLRGLCFSKEPETFYEVLGYRGKKPYFHGYYGIMIYHLGEARWEIFDTTKQKSIATLALASTSLYPVGRFKWLVQHSICNYLLATEIELSLSVCQNSEFTCSNGDCIPKDGRCDSKDDCSDLSDEDDCQITLLPKGYRSERPPENSTADGISYLGSTVEILRFMDISDVRRLVSVEFVIELTWLDPRPRYLNLRDTMEWNQLHERDRRGVWRPQLKFPNVLNGDISLLDEQVFLRRIGQPEPADFNDVRMGEPTRETGRVRDE